MGHRVKISYAAERKQITEKDKRNKENTEADTGQVLSLSITAERSLSLSL